MKEATRQKRALLKQLSAGAKALVKTGAYTNVNECLVDMYREETGAQEFNTFHGWKEKGYMVKKDGGGVKFHEVSTAYLVWGTPKNYEVEKEEEREPETEGKNEYKFFPLCFLFSDQQVEKLAA